MRRVPTLLIMCLVCLTAGCYEEHVVYNSWDQLSDISDKPRADRKTPGKIDAEKAAGWAILVDTFTSDKGQRYTNELISRLTREANMKDLWVKQDGVKTVVLRGRYRDTGSKEAAADLKQTRDATLDGLRLYEGAQFVAITPTSEGPSNALDLRQFHGQGIYTMQVAAFDAAVGKDYQQKAEKYAAQLRAKGETAFFYHGPSLSIVTVGAFTMDDFVSTEKTGPDGTSHYMEQEYGPKMLEIQKKYPHNIVDGSTIKEAQSDGSKVEQSSFIVQAP